MRLAYLLCAAPLFAATDSAAEQFEMKVRPILANRCYGCHSTAPLGGLAVNSRNGLLKGGKTGPAVVPGKPEESLLIQAVAHTNEKMKMPLGAARMPDSEIAVLTEWIKAGAYWPEVKVAATPGKGKYVITAEQRNFWAFQPVRKVNGSIDSLVGEQLRAKGLTPNRPAARRDLIRRAYIDLTGLPPSFAEVRAFETDASPEALAKVVDKLLAAPQYGERWARYWLDVARYSDDRMDSDVELPYPNSYRYRNWVIDALNQDMPYDLFVKAQIAGDQLDRKELAVGLGFYGLSPELTDDRVDVTTRGFMALTGACAQCHDHKFDPIPTKDYYALQGVFSSTKRAELELAPGEQVKAYKSQEKKINDVKKRIESFLKGQAEELAEMLASESPRYIRAARNPIAPAEGLDAEVLARWVRYLKTGPVDNKYLQGWQKESFDLSAFRQEAMAVLAERKKVDEKNLQAGAKNEDTVKGQTFALPSERYFLWRDLYFNDFYGREFKQEEDGLLWYGPNRGYYTSDGAIERFLTGRWKGYLADMRAELKDLQAALPPQYAFAHAIKDNPTAINERVALNGVPENLGEEAPRAFLSILSAGEPKPFSKGSGRLELAEAIANSANPLTARVMVNRIWQHHFGDGLVRTVSNFGRMGETPSHPELLDRLASSFIESGWSMKKLHREIMLSETYQRSAEQNEKNYAADPDNRLLWRANRQRLDAEAMRDTLLAVSGELDGAPGAKPMPLDKAGNRKRSIYGFVSRRKLDGTLALFDFPNPNLSAEKRIVTATPLQQLYFLNGEFLAARAEALAKKLTGSSDERIRQAYRTVFGREATQEELKLGKEFVAGGEWRAYAQVLLSANELLFVN